MIDYVNQFSKNYNKVPWAVFANFGEAHEDSVSLAAVLDKDIKVNELFHDEMASEFSCCIFEEEFWV